ncbi:RWD domain-containing protein 1 [Ischnura elegans]|uniref:RWD domain-containing protein 1 n=1 Tax=Ischnura elegans TaxID=197161 RepID=UPI001ED87358|nr:RWD domain-containing protein 1 [Ischnura elegans]
MDYMEEQSNEIEALDSIYCGDMEILSTEPNYKFKIPIKSEEYEPDSENGLACSLKFSYTPTYPETVPELEILDRVNFEEDDEQLLSQHIMEQAEENLGMVMVFTLVSAAQEWLNLKWDDIRKEKEEAISRKLKEDEEAEMKRIEGTHVTVESFLAWKTQFDQERRLLKKSDKDEKDLKKLTGKQLFMADKTLDQSDLKFLEEGDEAVKVDESLFQELDELDIDNEDLDLDEEDSS